MKPTTTTPPALRIVAGDTNVSLGRLRVDLARPAGGHAVPGDGVDNLAFAGSAEVDDVVVRRLGKHGSDHHDAILFHIVTKNHGNVTVLTWNPWVGQRPLNVADALGLFSAEHAPDFIVLSEAYRLHRVLPRLGAYHVHHGKPGRRGGPESERADCAVLVRVRGWDVEYEDTMKMRRRWAYRGNRKGARRYPWVVATRETPGQSHPLTVSVMAVHYPWGAAAEQNGRAIAESLTRTSRWLARNARRRTRRRG